MALPMCERWEANIWDDFQLRNLFRLHPISDGNAVCPELANVTRVGEEMLDSTPTERFRLTESSNLGPVGNVDDSSSAGSTGNTLDRTWDLWVGPKGHLLQTELIGVYPAVDDQPEIRVEVTSVISGVGEPNVITAPNTGGPTPVPSRSATTTSAGAPTAASTR